MDFIKHFQTLHSVKLIVDINDHSLSVSFVHPPLMDVNKDSGESTMRCNPCHQNLFCLSGIKNLSKESFEKEIVHDGDSLEGRTPCTVTVGLSEFHGFNLTLNSELILKGDISFGECHYQDTEMSLSI